MVDRVDAPGMTENAAVHCARASVTWFNIVLQRIRAESGDKRRSHLARCHFNNLLLSQPPFARTPWCNCASASARLSAIVV